MLVATKSRFRIFDSRNKFLKAECEAVFLALLHTDIKHMQLRSDKYAILGRQNTKTDLKKSSTRSH